MMQSIYVAPDEEESGSTGSPVSEPSTLDSPELTNIPLAYPAPESLKFEPVMADVATQEPFVSPVDSVSSSSSSSVFPQFTSDNGDGAIPDALAWANGLKGNGLPTMDNLAMLANYDGMDVLENVQGFNDTGLDFNGMYADFNFAMGDENVVDPSNHYI